MLLCVIRKILQFYERKKGIYRKAIRNKNKLNKSYFLIFIIFKYFCWRMTKKPGTYFVDINKTTWVKFWFSPLQNVAQHQLEPSSNNLFPRWVNSTCAIPLGHCITCQQCLRDGGGKSKALMRFEQGGLSPHLTAGSCSLLCFTTVLRNIQKSTLVNHKMHLSSQCSQCYFAASGALKGAQRQKGVGELEHFY